MKKFVYFFILIICTVLLAEIVTSIFYYHQYGKNKLALAELYHTVKDKQNRNRATTAKQQQQYKNQELIRTGEAPAMYHQLVDETLESNYFIYEPWLEFRFFDYSGTYVNKKGFERTSVPGFVQKGTDTITIWFMGGSTTFGFMSADSETIPSQFAGLWKEHAATTASLEVHNFGVPYYFSYQEYQLFIRLLGQKKRPDYVIFIDGLNDFWCYQNTYYQAPFFSDQLFNNMKEHNPEFLNSAAATFPRLTAESLTNSQCDTLLHHYLSTNVLIEKVATAYQVKPFFVIQPVPYTAYDQRSKDPICSKTVLPQFDYIYPKLKAAFRKKGNTIYLGDLHQNGTPLPYIDAFHYSPAFNKQIADVLLQSIIKSIP
jgi:hypothetical protein